LNTCNRGIESKSGKQALDMAIEQTIKQRLIGAIVLVALAVIFLPSILGKKNDRKTYSSKIPPIESSVNTSSAPNKSDENGSQVAHSSSLKTESQLSSRQPSDPAQTVTERETPPPNRDQRKESAKLEQDTKLEQDIKKQHELSVTRETELSENGVDKATSVFSEDMRLSTNNSISESSSTLEKAEKHPTERTGQSLFSRDSWVVQVGSFSSHANAELLAKRLEEYKLKSFVRPVELKDKPLLYRVYVGPWLTREQADAVLPKVTDISRLKPIVVKWQPNKQ
jgi:DedD protein